jgi:predicted regulator of Ras-like GTPase activity (Roadblock/LC7/MglB family)
MTGWISAIIASLFGAGETVEEILNDDESEE